MSLSEAFASVASDTYSESSLYYIYCNLWHSIFFGNDVSVDVYVITMSHSDFSLTTQTQANQDDLR